MPRPSAARPALLGYQSGTLEGVAHVVVRAVFAVVLPVAGMAVVDLDDVVARVRRLDSAVPVENDNLTRLVIDADTAALVGLLDLHRPVQCALTVAVCFRRPAGRQCSARPLPAQLRF
ncbi:hypothetical protein ABZ403_19830 [Micromonospora zamorensis]|uniref:hypothetical protein n=1 Tax=Micromonospora zamorensis TaxID=709883 RepID=UPI0033D96A95